MSVPTPAPKRELPVPFYGAPKPLFQSAPPPTWPDAPPSRLESSQPRTRVMTAEDMAWEEYLIPDLDDDVLRNKLGSKDEPYGCPDWDVLNEREVALTAIRMIELKQQPIPGEFDYGHMKKIHHHLFQDVYDWAGEERNVDLNKAGYDYAFPAHIEVIWKGQHDVLKDDQALHGITDPAEFADKLAFHWGMVNVAHAFREGNTRSQTVFFHQLAAEAGWDLDISMLGPNHPESIREDFIDARFHHQSNGFDHAPLAQVLTKALTCREPELQRNVAGQPAPAALPGSSLADRVRRFPELVPDFEFDTESVRTNRHARQDDPQF